MERSRIRLKPERAANPIGRAAKTRPIQASFREYPGTSLEAVGHASQKIESHHGKELEVERPFLVYL
jgi:hypothetical protein